MSAMCACAECAQMRRQRLDSEVWSVKKLAVDLRVCLCVCFEVRGGARNAAPCDIQLDGSLVSSLSHNASLCVTTSLSTPRVCSQHTNPSRHHNKARHVRPLSSQHTTIVTLQLAGLCPSPDCFYSTELFHTLPGCCAVCFALLLCCPLLPPVSHSSVLQSRPDLCLGLSCGLGCR